MSIGTLRSTYSGRGIAAKLVGIRRRHRYICFLRTTSPRLRLASFSGTPPINRRYHTASHRARCLWTSASPQCTRREGRQRDCCGGACKQHGLEMYRNFVKSIVRLVRCVKACMDHRKESLYKLFERSLTRASTTEAPYHDLGYYAYDSTPIRFRHCQEDLDPFSQS